MALVFHRLRAAGFDLRFTYHADAILHQDFVRACEELEEIIGGISIPVGELVRSGGGEALITQRLRGSLQRRGWEKGNFRFEKKINDATTFSQSHEVDHVKAFEKGTIALEIEWNNKDPFFDRDLENFNRLHADGVISAGIIVTRGRSLQDGLEAAIRGFAARQDIASFAALAAFDVEPTPRQRENVVREMNRTGRSFADAWARHFVRDKFGSATTHWAKLEARLERGVGSPCPIVAIGIPLSTLAD